jgi:hypothetical protein
VLDLFQKKGTRYTFRVMTEQELEDMWYQQSETADEEPPPVLKAYVEEVDRGLEAAHEGRAFAFNAGTANIGDDREFQAEEPLYRIPEEQQDEVISLQDIEKGEKNNEENTSYECPENLHARLKAELEEIVGFASPTQRGEHARQLSRRQRDLWNAMDDEQRAEYEAWWRDTYDEVPPLADLVVKLGPIQFPLTDGKCILC